MFDLGEEEVAEKHGASRALLAMHEILHLIRPIIGAHKGVGVEEALYIFKDPAHAVKACLQLRGRCRAHAEAGDEFVRVGGYGVHTGKLLFVPGTDVHWGDPVNTASKLGEDLAEDEDILITEAVYSACGSPDDFADVTFAEVMLTRSNVQFRAYSVKGSGEDAHPSRVSLHYARHKAISKTDVTTSIGESSGES